MNIAIYHKRTGDIKQVVQCDAAHAPLQAPAWGPDYTWGETTPDVHPNTHWWDLSEGKAVRVPEVDPPVNRHDQITQGFPSGNRLYPSSPTDQTNMVQVATVGGKLWSMSQDGTWSFDEHTAAEGAVVLRAFIDYKDRIRESS